MTEAIDELFTGQSQTIAQRAYEIAVQQRQSIIDVSHVFLSLLDYPDETLSQVFDDISLNIERLKAETLRVVELQLKVPFWKGRKYKVYITPLVKESIDDAIALSKELREQKASSVHIFWGVVHTCMEEHPRPTETQYRMCEIFTENHITPQKIVNVLRKTKRRSEDQQMG